MATDNPGVFNGLRDEFEQMSSEARTKNPYPPSSWVAVKEWSLSYLTKKQQHDL